MYFAVNLQDECHAWPIKVVLLSLRLLLIITVIIITIVIIITKLLLLQHKFGYNMLSRKLLYS